MDRTYLQWNIVNWITVFLMAVLGYSILSAAAAVWQTKIQGKPA